MLLGLPMSLDLRTDGICCCFSTLELPIGLLSRMAAVPQPGQLTVFLILLPWCTLPGISDDHCSSHPYKVQAVTDPVLYPLISEDRPSAYNLRHPAFDESFRFPFFCSKLQYSCAYLLAVLCHKSGSFHHHLSKKGMRHSDPLTLLLASNLTEPPVHNEFRYKLRIMQDHRHSEKKERSRTLCL